MTKHLRVVVLGYIIRGPLGGMSWHHLQYVTGLMQQGHDVWFIEDSDDYPSCYNPVTGVLDTDPTYGLEYASRVFHPIGLPHRWAYFDAAANRWYGPAANKATTISSSADVVLNVSGINPPRTWWEQAPARVLIDTDPVFTQVKHLSDPQALEAAAIHTDFFSFGENFGHPDCSIPDDGLPWKPTRQPVVTKFWPLHRPTSPGRYTTVMQWESYQPATWRGRDFGMKADSFEPFVNLPSKVSIELELVLGSARAPRTRLRQHGWHLKDPHAVSQDPWTFQSYIRHSRAEFAVAKHGYVVSQSGWFSERTTGYLASGRPALAQDTGFTKFLPTGQGLFAFRDLNDALSGIEEIEANYPLHCRHARTFVEEHFSAAHVLKSLLQRLA